MSKQDFKKYLQKIALKIRIKHEIEENIENYTETTLNTLIKDIMEIMKCDKTVAINIIEQMQKYHIIETSNNKIKFIIHKPLTIKDMWKKLGKLR